MRVGEKGNKGEIYQRCDSCGDSKNPRHGHKAIYPDGSTYCFRCGEYSCLSIQAMLRIANEESSVDEELDREQEDWKTIQRKRRLLELPRYTCLEPFVNPAMPDHYCFEQRTPSGQIVGYHNRSMHNKTFVNEGKRGFGFCGDKLRSSPSEPLIIVEGPFDVTKPNHVCVFGSLHLGALRPLRLQCIWLWPDPDMLDNIEKRKHFANLALTLVEEHMVLVRGIIVSDGDPDDYSTRREFELNEVMSWKYAERYDE